MFRKIIGVSVIVVVLAMALPALAQNTSVKITCVETAVATREAALDAAITAQTSALNAAYTVRARELAGAYSNITTAKAVQAGTKVSWADFSKSVKSAAAAWRTSRNAAWSAFRTAAKACKAPAGVSDSANSGSEVSGQ
jgi:hypothetical protein